MVKKIKENEKAVIARERKEGVLKMKKMAADAAAEDARWTDQGSTAKERRAKEREDKASEKSAALERKKAQLEEEDKMMSQVKQTSKAKQNLRALGELPAKVTQFEMSKVREQEALEREKKEEAKKMEAEKIFTNDPLQFVNMNRLQSVMMSEDNAKYGAGNVLHASGMEGALKTLSINSINASDLKADRHPEKRVKAAFKAFEAERLPELKADYPQLKLSQQKEKQKKEWDLSSANPQNQVVTPV